MPPVGVYCPGKEGAGAVPAMWLEGKETANGLGFPSEDHKMHKLVHPPGEYYSAV